MRGEWLDVFHDLSPGNNGGTSNLRHNVRLLPLRQSFSCAKRSKFCPISWPDTWTSWTTNRWAAPQLSGGRPELGGSSLHETPDCTNNTGDLHGTLVAPTSQIVSRRTASGSGMRIAADGDATICAFLAGRCCSCHVGSFAIAPFCAGTVFCCVLQNPQSR